MATDATKATPKKGWPKAFLASLMATGSVTFAAATAGVERSTAYRLRRRSRVFGRAWETALERGIDALEDEVKSRALDRTDDKSHLLLMFAVKAHRPKYRDGKAEDPNVHPTMPSPLRDKIATAYAKRADAANRTGRPTD